jgi:3-oxoadipate enol-lactonase
MTSSNQPIHFTTVRAGQIDLGVAQCGAGAPVVFVHGFPLDNSMWDGQLTRIGKSRRAIAVDLRGFGRSEVVPGTATMAQMADDIDALLTALDIAEPVVLCGLSMGGYVAFQFWKRHRSRVRALVLCDTRAIADTPEAAAGRLKTADDVIAHGMGPLAEAMLPKLFAPATFQARPEIIEAARKTILAQKPEGVAAALRGMAERPDTRHCLPEVSQPTLVVVGEHDAISTVDEMRGLAGAILPAEFVVIPNSGHMTPLENAPAFDTALEKFLASLDS